jgi:DnaJ-class molecular chaperone
MSDAYQVLGLDADSADDANVQAAYVSGLREHPPERDPEGFQRLRDAYEQLRTRRRRLEYALFHQQAVPTVAELAAHLLTRGTPRRPSAEQIRRALTTKPGASEQ